MPTIKISRPLVIDMKVVEIDNYLPSIKMGIKVEIIHPTGNYTYNADDIWFECKKWDEFILSLHEVTIGSSHTALLENISGSFIIKVLSNEQGVLFNFESEEINVGEGVARFNFTSPIDDDILSGIKNGFTSFEKWW